MVHYHCRLSHVTVFATSQKYIIKKEGKMGENRLETWNSGNRNCPRVRNV